MKKARLAHGTRILYWDTDANGHTTMLGPVSVVAARGLGVLCETTAARRFRIARADVARVVVTCRTCAGLGAVRDGRPAHEMFGSPCGTCGGAGWTADRF